MNYVYCESVNDLDMFSLALSSNSRPFTAKLQLCRHSRSYKTRDKTNRVQKYKTDELVNYITGMSLNKTQYCKVISL